MSIKKNTLIILFSFIFSTVSADEDLKSIGKFKDWESFVLSQEGSKICFAQSIPVVRAPKKLKREPSRLFVSFRPNENIKNEISVTNGYEFKSKAPVAAKSGKKTYDLFSKGRFAKVLVQDIIVGYVGEINSEVLDNFKIRTPIVGFDIDLSLIFE